MIKSNGPPTVKYDWIAPGKIMQKTMIINGEPTISSFMNKAGKAQTPEMNTYKIILTKDFSSFLKTDLSLLLKSPLVILDFERLSLNSKKMYEKYGIVR